MDRVTFNFPTVIRFGAGVRDELSACLQKEGITRPLIVTDRQIAKLNFPGEIQKGLSDHKMAPALFSDVDGNPVKSQVTAGVCAYLNHHADGLIGLGGGAALDVTKAIALMIHHPGDLFDYEDGLTDARPIDQPLPFWVALPTTSGTGSEVGRSAVISDEATHIKKIFFSPRLMARTVFADPELTLDLPPQVTAATGMDALTHCVESYLSKGYHPLCDGVALEGLRLAAIHLPRAVSHPREIEARSGMMMASLMGAVAFQKGLGLTHSLAHALSTHANFHHGLANGIMIDHALPFNLPVVRDRFERMAQAVGLKDASAEGFIHWLTAIKAQIGIPGRLSERGIVSRDLPILADIAFQDVCHQCNPRPVRREDFMEIYTQAL